MIGPDMYLFLVLFFVGVVFLFCQSVAKRDKKEHVKTRDDRRSAGRGRLRSDHPNKNQATDIKAWSISLSLPSMASKQVCPVFEYLQGQ
jgi:hypothetical protein